MSVPAVTGVVLAGGHSTRFGDENKALATFDGETILERVVSTLRTATGTPPVVCTRTADQQEAYARHLTAAVEYAADASTHEGPVAGVLGALDAVETPWMFVCGCDMPRLSAAAIQWQLDRLAAAVVGPNPPAAVAVASADGTAQPLHACFQVDAVERVRDDLPEAVGVRALFETVAPVRTLPVEGAPASVRLAQSLVNVNTREELAALAAEVRT